MGVMYSFPITFFCMINHTKSKENNKVQVLKPRSRYFPRYLLVD